MLDAGLPSPDTMPSMREIGGIGLEVRASGAWIGAVVARGCTTGPAPAELEEAITAEVARANSRTDTEAATKAVRDLLRHGKYKPTGRGKPASEYLLNAAREGRFPRINNLVDINNLISLGSLLPISLIDLALAATDRFVVRRGSPGEAYVFNAGGQTIELEDLLLVAHQPGDQPCANPVKDSMATKLTEASRDVMAVLYAPASLRAELEAATAAFAEALGRHGGAAEVARAILSPSAG